MIPVRVYVEGFLCYREGVEFTFDGSPLWVLTGDNGVGKSSVFDAMRFALYGMNRDSKRSYSDLINHDSDKLVVEFDFVVNEDLYRIKRTANNKRASRQAFHISGPNAPYDRKNTQAITNTDSDEGFKAWVSETIGLEDKHFTSSVLLQQDKSDKLLNLTPAERHTVLTELVDLSAYVQLEDRAKKKHRCYKNNAENYQSQLQSLPTVSADEISQLEKLLGDKEKFLHTNRAELDALIKLKVHAETWQTLIAQEREQETAISSVETLAKDASRLQMEAKRLEELDEIIPRLTQVVDEQARIDKYGTQINQSRVLLSKAQNDLDALLPQQASLEKSLAQLTKDKESHQTRLQKLLSAQKDLEVQYRDLEQLDALHSQTQKLQTQIDGYPNNLEER